MKYLNATRPSFVLVLAFLILLASVNIAVSQRDSAPTVGVSSRGHTDQGWAQRPASTKASSGGGYDLSWWTVDGGGATFNTSDGYSLGGTAGQPDAAVWQDNGYTLAGGFWAGAVVEYRIYLPLVLRDF